MKRNLFLASVAFVAACSGTGQRLEPLPSAGPLELERFMGDWYVLGFIPLWPERNAHNGIETYELGKDGVIQTTYRFRPDSFDAPLKTFRPTATVVAETGDAHWKMQFLWPFKADYRIAWLAQDYSATIIGRKTRDYVWIMARSPVLPAGELEALEQKVAAMGYDMTGYRRHPQRWPEQEPRPPLAAVK